MNRLFFGFKFGLCIKSTKLDHITDCHTLIRKNGNAAAAGVRGEKK